MKKILGLIVFLTFSINASAMWLAEPLVGYISGSTKKTGKVSGTSSTDTFTGTGYGVRLGYILSNGLYFAGEYDGSALSTKSDSANATAYDVAGTAMGAIIGYQRGMWKFYAGYGFSDEFTVDLKTQKTKYAGTNMKVGVGYLFARNFALNVEYIMPKYTKYSITGDSVPANNVTDVEVSNTYSAYDTTAFMVNLSFPFMFGGR